MMIQTFGCPYECRKSFQLSLGTRIKQTYSHNRFNPRSVSMSTIFVRISFRRGHDKLRSYFHHLSFSCWDIFTKRNRFTETHSKYCSKYTLEHLGLFFISMLCKFAVKGEISAFSLKISLYFIELVV